MSPEETLTWYNGYNEGDLVQESGLASVAEGENEEDFEMVGDAQGVPMVRPPPPPLMPPPDLPTVAGEPVTPVPFPVGDAGAVTAPVGVAPVMGLDASSSAQPRLPENRSPERKEERHWCWLCSEWVENAELGFHFESAEHKAAAEGYYQYKETHYNNNIPPPSVPKLNRSSDGSYSSNAWHDEDWNYCGDYSWYEDEDAWSGYDWWSQSSASSDWWGGSSGGSSSRRSSRR